MATESKPTTESERARQTLDAFQKDAPMGDHVRLVDYIAASLTDTYRQAMKDAADRVLEETDGGECAEVLRFIAAELEKKEPKDG